MRQVIILLSGFLAVAAPCVGQPSPSEFEGRFEESLRWIDQNALRAESGLLLRNSDVYSTWITERDTFKALPMSVGTECVQTKSECVGEDEPVGELPHWHVTKVKGDSARLNYANARYNAFFARSLLRMYEATGKDRYLDRAGTQVDRLLSELDGDQWIRYRADDEGPIYIGRLNSMVLQATYDYNRLTGGDRREALERIAEAYKHTDEGTWNHWQGSVIGVFLSARITGQELEDIGHLRKERNQLFAQVDRYQGKIPYIMSESHPDYPDFRRTYQTLSAMYFAKTAARTDFDVKVLTSHVWPLVWAEAVKNANAKTYWANNSATALHLLQGTGQISDDWMIHQTETSTYQNSPTNLREAISKLRGASALAKYWSIRRGMPEVSSSVAVKKDGPTPNPARTSTEISFYLSKRVPVNIDVYDQLGRRVRSIHRPHVQGTTVVRERLDVADLASGVYFVRVRAGSQTFTYKMTVL